MTDPVKSSVVRGFEVAENARATFVPSRPRPVPDHPKRAIPVNESVGTVGPDHLNETAESHQHALYAQWMNAEKTNQADEVMRQRCMPAETPVKEKSIGETEDQTVTSKGGEEQGNLQVDPARSLAKKTREISEADRAALSQMSKAERKAWHQARLAQAPQTSKKARTSNPQQDQKRPKSPKTRKMSWERSIAQSPPGVAQLASSTPTAVATSPSTLKPTQSHSGVFHGPGSFKHTVPASMRFDDPKYRAKSLKHRTIQRTLTKKTIPLFSHLTQFEKETSVTKNASKRLHPAVIQLGLAFSEFRIVGATSRCIAMLDAFKKLMKDYQTPDGATLSRHLPQHLGPHISFLNEIRPISVSMGNAVRYLKHQISLVGIDMPDFDAKRFLVERVDKFIYERIELAREAISTLSQSKINQGDVILTYGRSKLVEKILLEAHNRVEFRVVVVDSRPKFEGRRLLQHLNAAGIDCTYIMVGAVSYMIGHVTKVVLGAHCLFANGAAMSRVGTAQVALLARQASIPVLFTCETYKFCERVQLDSFVFNEIADPDELKIPAWRDIPSMKCLNILYDVTPASFITGIVTEVGIVPCSSVPVVMREYKPMVDIS